MKKKFPEKQLHTWCLFSSSFLLGCSQEERKDMTGLQAHFELIQQNRQSFKEAYRLLYHASLLVAFNFCLKTSFSSQMLDALLYLEHLKVFFKHSETVLGWSCKKVICKCPWSGQDLTSHFKSTYFSCVTNTWNDKITGNDFSEFIPQMPSMQRLKMTHMEPFSFVLGYRISCRGFFFPLIFPRSDVWKQNHSVAFLC